MTWDDQDNKDQKKGPWGAREPGKSQRPRDPQQKPGPDDEIPDLDEVLRQAQHKLGSMFNPQSGGEAKKGIGLVMVMLAALWLSTGFYRVLPGEDVVLLTFGKWTSTRSEAGLGYHIPWPVQAVMKVNVAFDRRVEIGFRDQPPSRIAGDADTEKNNISSESQMLTGDENIVDIDFVVTWRIGDAKKYLFQIRDPEMTVKKVAESAMREIIGRSPIQKALTEGRADIEAQSGALMQKMLDDYQSGVEINSVQLLSVDPPAPVVDAFDDVQRARADMERTKNEAETYHNDILPRARGDAQKLLQDADAYRQAVISKAQGEAGRFLSVYDAYVKAKDVTARRMYIETMQKVMESSKKVIVSDGKGSSVVPYLSLDKVQDAAKPAEKQ